MCCARTRKKKKLCKYLPRLCARVRVRALSRKHLARTSERKLYTVLNMLAWMRVDRRVMGGGNSHGHTDAQVFFSTEPSCCCVRKNVMEIMFTCARTHQHASCALDMRTHTQSTCCDAVWLLLCFLRRVYFFETLFARTRRTRTRGGW